MHQSGPKSSRTADAKSLVCAAAEAILKLALVEKMGVSMRVEGVEREILVGAVRAEAGGDLDDPAYYSLADFVPMAFVRVALSDTGVSLPTHFGRKDSSNRIREYRQLSEVPNYREALALAQAWWPDRPEDVRSVARWHGAMALVESALARGKKASDLEFAPTLLNGPTRPARRWRNARPF